MPKSYQINRATSDPIIDSYIAREKIDLFLVGYSTNKDLDSEVYLAFLTPEEFKSGVVDGVSIGSGIRVPSDPTDALKTAFHGGKILQAANNLGLSRLCIATGLTWGELEPKNFGFKVERAVELTFNVKINSQGIDCIITINGKEYRVEVKLYNGGQIPRN